jgi:putative pyruvate formate lyase activating enzyme
MADWSPIALDPLSIPGYSQNMLADSIHPENLFKCCGLCPRKCGVDRTADSSGFCGERNELRMALVCRHFGEEPPLAGKGGSGTVFFTGCTLKCEFCQNCQISRGELGRTVGIEEFADILLALQNQGAENVNLVTGTQFVPLIAEGLGIARRAGLALPVLWNTSAYEDSDALPLIGSITDVFLPDYKTSNPRTADQLFRAPDYPERAADSILWMARQQPLKYSPSGMLMSGTVMRHLVLPGEVEDSRRIIKWFAENIKGNALLSVMFQYLPPSGPARSTGSPNRAVDEVEYCQVLAEIEDSGVTGGFIQKLDSESQWLPDFQRRYPFPESFSQTVWHWRDGYVE